MELTPELQDKKIFLIEGLKRTYKDQYDAIQPLPYIKDRLYCVDKVFVEGGVEICLAPELTRGNGGSWERLESYKSIYTDFQFNFKRRMIQGEPGYGKSTLTLQLAYDWCNGVSESPMNNVEILILLRLRQLGRVKSLFGAIKSFLLFHEPRVSKHEIEKIIRSCSSVHIILDGYDEYPGRGSNDNDDVHRIIKMELFEDFDVSLTTRYLPECLRKRKNKTKWAKLTGFDDKARDEYIRKAVVGNNDEAMEEIKQRLYENSILADLCQVPLVFVMFAHMAHDHRDFEKFKSVTQFFKHILRCFYDHLKQKFKDNRSNDICLHAMEHRELDKIAFEGLNKENQQLSWIKTGFCQRVGPESYDQYILIGILVEEDVVSDDSTEDNVLFTTMVRFYHKLFCEWYAAHHLVTLAKIAYYLEDKLMFLDPFDLQYLFRFACGLDPDAGKKLINHLKSLPGGDTFAILCILEQTGDVNDIMDSVKDLCSRDVKIQEGDSALLQRSTTQLLEIASNNDIPISCLHLDYSSIKFEGDTIILHSGIPLPKLPTVDKIHLDGSNVQHDNTETLPGIFSYRNLFRRHDDAQSANQKTLTEKDILNWFRYGMKCRCIKELMFHQLQLPNSVSPEAFRNKVKTRNIQVRWRPFDIDFHLDLQNGHWEVDDIQVIINKTSGTVSLSERNNVLQHTSTLQLLEVARNHDIPVSILHLEYSSIKFEGDTIILHSGIPLPILPTVENIHIDASNIEHDNTESLSRSKYDTKRTLTTMDVMNLFHYGMKCGRVKEMMFNQFQLPTSVSPEAFTDKMKTQKVQVRWRPFDIHFHLDLETGHWEVDNIDTLRQQCSDTVYIKKSDGILKQASTIMFIHIASNHEIPISCLHLEYSAIKFEGDNTVLHSSPYLRSGISLPILPTVEKIHIAGRNAKDDDTETLSGIFSHRNVYRRLGDQETLTEKDILKLFRYGMKCRRIKELMFGQLQLPTSITPETFTNIMKTRNIQVRWRPFDIDFHLDLQNGHWEVEDNRVLENICFSTVSIDGKHSVLQQRSTVELLHAAHRHNVPISSLLFSESFQTIDNGIIILNNGIRVTNLPPLQKMYVVEKNNRNPRAIKDQDIANILLCVIKGQHFNEICFEGWLMPVSLSSALTNWMLSLALNVLWRPFEKDFRLDLQTGHWEVVDNQVMENIRYSTVSIDGKHSVLQQRSTVQLLHVAHRYNIPISSLLFNESFNTTAHETIILNNGIQLTNLPQLQKMHVVNKDDCNTSEITEQDVVNILLCAMEDQHFNVLCFEGCRLPVSVSSLSFTKAMISRTINVWWCPFDSLFHLDLQTGLWEVDDFEAIRDSFSHEFSINASDTGLQQRSKVQLLYIAANHNIPISYVHVNKCVKYYEEESFILQSGVLLAPLTTVQHICIEKGMGTKVMKKIRTTDMKNILHFGMKCQQLKDISFRSCMLSLDNMSTYIPSEMKERDIRVTWPEGGYHLNLQTGDWEVADLDPIRALCTKTVQINFRDSEPLQRDTIRLLENAAKHDIPITCLNLKNSFSKIDAGIIILKSGLHLSCPVSVKKIVIQTEEGREMTQTKVVDILMFVQQSHLLEELEFDGCVLPPTFSSESIPAELQSRNIKVFWSNYGYSLNLQSGLWEVNEDEVRNLCTQSTFIRRDDSELLQRCTIQFLENASNYDIRISCLYLKESLSKIDAGDVILHSGLRLPCPVSVKKVEIDAEEGREMTETEVVDILMFVKQSHMLKRLKFSGFLLPKSIPAESIPSILKSRNVKVKWKNGQFYYGKTYTLNLQSGRWMRRRQEMTYTDYNDTVRRFRKKMR